MRIRKTLLSRIMKLPKMTRIGNIPIIVIGIRIQLSRTKQIAQGSSNTLSWAINRKRGRATEKRILLSRNNQHMSCGKRCSGSYGTGGYFANCDAFTLRVVKGGEGGVVVCPIGIGIVPEEIQDTGRRTRN